MARLPWRWPLRIGLLGQSLVAREVLDAVLRAGRLPPPLVQVYDLAIEPTAVDVLLVTGPLAAAADMVIRTRPRANAVVVLDQLPAGWPIADAQLALIRAATGAIVTGIGRGSEKTLLTETISAIVERLLLDLSHSHPLDAALSDALQRRGIIVGELDQLVELNLPHLAKRLASDLRSSAERLRRMPKTFEPVGGEAPPTPTPSTRAHLDAAAALDSSAGRLDLLALGLFTGESHEALDFRNEADQADATLSAAIEPRLLQCYVGPESLPPLRPTNTLQLGRNAVDVFIGPLETGALVGGPLPNSVLGFTADTRSVRLTIVMVPLVPRGTPQRAEVEVPRIGRSASARFLLDVPAEASEVSARILVLHRNRVLQTAVLHGTAGAAAELAELAVIRPDLEHVDDRRSFDLAIVANHDAAGRSTLIAHRNDITEVAAMQEVGGVTGRLRKVLLQAAFERGQGGKLSAKRFRSLLIELAVLGRELRTELGGYLTLLDGLQRIQILTARSAVFFPLELVYDRAAPDENAQLCPLMGGGR